MTEKIYFVNGDFVPADEASIPVTDLALVRGYGVFDYFRTYGGLPIQIERNIQRFRNSADVIGLAMPHTDEEIEGAVYETLRRNGFDEASVRIIATGGDADDFITPQGKTRLLVYVEPLKPLPVAWYIEGVRLITVDDERDLPLAKSLNYISAIVAQRKAREAGAVEALYRDRHGDVREGTTTNYFAFYGDKKVLTPEAGILPGVTRRRMIEILEANGFAVVERAISYDELLKADELIITAANKQVVPVVELDAHTFGDEPGPWARHVMAGFRDYVVRHAKARDAALSAD